MTQAYQPGQRWITDSEAEPGLGTILMTEGRLLTVCVAQCPPDPCALCSGR